MSLTSAGSSSTPANAVLVLHDSELDPLPFLNRLTLTPEPPTSGVPADEEQVEVPWTIDNKYYTAHIAFRSCAFDELMLEARGVEVVMFLFQDTPPNPLPPTLVKVITEEPRDIALAVRVLPTPKSANANDEACIAGDNEPRRAQRYLSWEETEELFDELGMELVDEGAMAEEDDERPISPLESIRQTLMTHMWPNMVRKPLGVSMPADLDDEDEVGHPGETGAGEEDEGPKFDDSDFPVSFTTPPALSPSSPRDGGDAGAFPSLQELLSQIAQNSPPQLGGPSSRPFQGIGDMDEVAMRQKSALERLEMLELDDEIFGDLSASGLEGAGPSEEEYARLDDWLDEDRIGEGHSGDVEGSGEDGFVMLDNDNDNPSTFDSFTDDSHPTSGDATLRAPRNPQETQQEDEGFEDDFAAFQSAPPALSAAGRSSGGSQLPLDPTPLLLRLQSVRAELMGVEDPNERRKRAGKEVELIMRGLGMEAGLGLDDLDDLDDLNDMP